MTVVGSDIASGQEVKWYYGATVVTETLSISSTDVTATYKALGKKAEYGSVVATKNGALLAVTEETASGAGAATETSGTSTISYTGMTNGDSVIVQYIDIETSPLVQIAACMDVKTSFSVDVKTAAVHGQANKLKTIGAIDQEAELEEFQYSQDFLSQVLGEQVADSPASGMNKLSTKVKGVKKLAALVGKRANTAGTITYKWILFGAQATGIDKEFPTEDFYKDSVKFSVDEYLEVDLVA